MISADGTNVTYSVFKWVLSYIDSEDVYKIRTFLGTIKSLTRFSDNLESAPVDFGGKSKIVISTSCFRDDFQRLFKE